MCFFIVYLLKIITSITKANTIIVSTTKPNKSRYIISNKIASIIAPPPHSQLSCGLKVANHICLSSFPMLESITYKFIKINTKRKNPLKTEWIQYVPSKLNKGSKARM